MYKNISEARTRVQGLNLDSEGKDQEWPEVVVALYSCIFLVVDMVEKRIFELSLQSVGLDWGSDLRVYGLEFGDSGRQLILPLHPDTLSSFQ